MRTGQIHFRISKDDHQPSISQIYDSQTEHHDIDAGCALKESLIGDMTPAQVALTQTSSCSSFSA